MRCARLPETFHGKQGVCGGLPPVAAGPLPAREGVDFRRLARLLDELLPEAIHYWRRCFCRILAGPFDPQVAGSRPARPITKRAAKPLLTIRAHSPFQRDRRRKLTTRSVV